MKADTTELERVARAIRDAEWQFIKPAPGRDYVDTLPLTPMNLAAAGAAIASMAERRANAPVA
jgi:hypothetical protein